MMRDDAPYKAGDRVRPCDLVGWSYTGLMGKPETDPKAVRRYRRGDWVLELKAFSDWRMPTQVVSCRTIREDQRWWREASRRRPRSPKS